MRVATTVVPVFLTFLTLTRDVLAQTCRWVGTAPICHGECVGEEQQRSSASASDYVPTTLGVQGLEATNTFGEPCATGQKAYCCKTPGISCRWDGTAPFCDGACKEGERASTPPPGTLSGAGCWTGDKVYCCRSTARVGANSQRLESSVPGVIYAVTPDHHLMWYRHDGRNDGKFTWAFNAGKVVGNGWQFDQLFSGGNGIIYAVTPLVPPNPAIGAARLASGGDLLWYRHDGRTDGSFTWAHGTGKKIGDGWGSFKEVFSGGDGVIYAVTSVVPATPATGIGPGMRAKPASGGDLKWYRHDGREDGSYSWAFGGGKKVGVGWGGFKHVFSGGGGVIYAIAANGDLMWYRHDGRNDGTFRWGFSEGKKVGIGWGSFKYVVAAGDGVIYAVTETGDLMWYRHDGRNDGTFRWAFPVGKKVGVGWNGFTRLFTD